VITEEKMWGIGEANKSQVYILPFLSDTYRDFVGNNLPCCQFRNCFIGDTVKGIDNKILLLYRFHSDPVFLSFEAELENHPLFIERYEVDKLHTMFVFKVPDKFEDDYNKIINGDYSKISAETKKHILDFHNLGQTSDTAGILYKTEKKRLMIEENLNDGIPRSRWIRIPLDVELLDTFNSEIEKFHKKYAIVPSILPNEEFNV